MPTKQSGIYNILENGENTHKSNYLTTNRPIPNTPFRIVGNTEQGYALTLGEYRMTPMHTTEIEAIDYLNTNQWEVIANMIIILNDKIKKLENLEANEQERINNILQK